jgi:uncharacterized membrane protein YraQ (UPF0718 family)
MKKNDIPFRYIFLALTLVGYGVMALFDPAYAEQAFSNFLAMLVRIIPILGVVFIIMFLTNLLITPERMEKHMGKESGLRGWIYSIFLGIIVSGPPYVLFPLLGDLKKQGMKNELLAAFLYNRNVKIPFLPVMVFYFGLSYTIILSAYIILFSILNGLLVGRFVAMEKK